MKQIVQKYWPLLKSCNCLDNKSRIKFFGKLAEKKDFRKLIKALTRHAKNHGHSVSMPRMTAKKMKAFETTVINLAKSSKKVPLKRRKKYIRQVGGWFPLLIPMLASVVASVLQA